MQNIYSYITMILVDYIPLIFGCLLTQKDVKDNKLVHLIQVF